MKTDIEIEADIAVEDALAALFENTAAPAGTHIQLDSAGVSMELVACDEGLGFDETTVISLAVSFGVGVGSGIVANTIYDAVGSSIRRITVGKRRIRPSREELKRALEVLAEHVDRDSSE